MKEARKCRENPEGVPEVPERSLEGPGLTPALESFWKSAGRFGEMVKLTPNFCYCAADQESAVSSCHSGTQNGQNFARLSAIVL